MAIGFSRNLLADKAIRYMDRTSNDVRRINEQLSSGFRINRASDDPAALAVSLTLTANAKISARAEANITDGISVLQVADGALQSARDVVGRITELAEQSASGSLSNTQRGALNKEVTELKSELIRIRDSVSFNGISLLAGGPMSGVSSTVASGNNSSTQVSADGRYVTYFQGTSIFQKDTSTGAVTTITSLASGIGAAASSGGDYVAYWGAGSGIYLYDRFAGTTTNLGTESSVDLLAISDDGSKIGIVSRNAYDPNGVSLGNLGNRYVATIDTATGRWKGDNGASNLTSYTSLALSSDGSRIGLVGNANVGFVLNTSDLTTTAFQTTGYAATKVRFASDNSVLFSSVSNVAGLNSSGASNVYKYDGTTYSAVTSITSGAGVTNFFATDRGASVTFATVANLVGLNPAGTSQLYKKDVFGSLKQLTSFTGTQTTNLTNVSGDGYTMYTASASALTAYDIRGETAVALDTGDGEAWGIAGRIKALDAAVRGAYFFDVSTQRSARVSLELARDNVARLGAAVGDVGSGLSRLESAYRSSRVKTEELKSANSRIISADIAEVSAKSIQNSAIQNVQAGLLGQSSKLDPEIALRLLESAAEGAKINY